ncbi:MAG: permease-like cell division protein FtsX [Magnetococcus sp. YQC-9]
MNMRSNDRPGAPMGNEYRGATPRGEGTTPGMPNRKPLKGNGITSRIFHARALQRAWRPFADKSLSHWTTCIVIALALTIHGVFSLFLVNANRVLSQWEDENQVTVFMRRGVEREQLLQVGKTIGGQPGVSELIVIPPAEAVARLKALLGEEAAILDELDENPLPHSFEFRLSRGDAARADVLIARIGAMPGVESVSYDRQWVERLAGVIQAIRHVGNTISLLLLLTVALIVSNTIKLTIIARRDEMEIMRFLGADDAFIRAPFIYEGVLQGVLGASGAMVLTAGLYFGAHGALLEMGQTFGVSLQLAFLPWSQMGLLVGLGAILGLSGALLSMARFLDV